MPEDVMIDVLSKMMWVAILLTAPPLLTAVLTGLIIGLIQAVTSIQEQTLSFVPKVLAIAAVFIVAGAWMLRLLMNFSSELISRLPYFGAL